MSVPEDSVFEVGEDAPFYRVDPEGNVYMQVLKAGDRLNDRAKKGDPIYFRYSRYSLSVWYADKRWEVYSGNETSMDALPCSFNYGDYSLPSTSQWGYGIQLPLTFVGVNSEVNLIIKSQYGWMSEMAAVIPYLYHVRYFRTQV